MSTVEDSDGANTASGEKVYVILQRRLWYLMRLSAVSPDSCNETHVWGIMYQNLG